MWRVRFKAHTSISMVFLHKAWSEGDMVHDITPGPAYIEFGYNKHSTITSIFFSLIPLTVLSKSSELF